MFEVYTISEFALQSGTAAGRVQKVESQMPILDQV